MNDDPRTVEGLANVLAELKFPLQRTDQILRSLETKLAGRDLDDVAHARKSLGHLMLAVEDVKHLQDIEELVDVDVPAMITEVAANLRVSAHLHGFAVVPLPRARFRRILGHLFAQAYDQGDGDCSFRITKHGMEFRHHITSPPGLNHRVLGLLLKDAHLHFLNNIEGSEYVAKMSWSQLAGIPHVGHAEAKEMSVNQLIDALQAPA